MVSPRVIVRQWPVRPLLGTYRARWSSSSVNPNGWNHFVHYAEIDEIGAAAAKSPGKWTLAVKDNINTKDFPTTAASAFLTNHAPPSDATIVAQLRLLGAVVVGKTNMDEFGMGSHSTHSIHGPVRNPNFENNNKTTTPRSAGGSSGGSAVAVRLRHAKMALGTDTGGSVRLPAAYTGVVGYKPSYGMLSRNGVIKYADSLDTVGLLARDVTDVYEVVFRSGLAWQNDPLDPTSLSEASRTRCLGLLSDQTLTKHDEQFARLGENLDGITIGIPQQYHIEELHPLILEAWKDAEKHLVDLGANVVPVELPSTRAALSAYYVIAPSEAASNLAKYDGQRYGTGAEGTYAEIRGSHFGPEVRNRILMGNFSLSSSKMDNYFMQAARVRRQVREDFDRVFARPNSLYEARAFDLSEMPEQIQLEDKKGPAQVDFILCPTAPTFPPLLDDIKKQAPTDAYMNDVFTVPASLAGLPAISVVRSTNNASEETGPVVGMQLIGQAWDDARLLSVASALHVLQKD